MLRRSRRYWLSFVLTACSTLLVAAPGFSADPAPQAVGTGTAQGSITDPSGAVIPGATVTVSNPVSHFHVSAVTDSAGTFMLRNLPLDHLHLTAGAPGFQSIQQDVAITSGVPVNLSLQLPIATNATTVNVEAGAEDLVENDPTMHTDLSNQLIAEIPKESVSSGLSSVITLATPGVVADSNGLFHPLGEHSDTTFSIDNQAISDQQSRTFSNQISTNVIQSMEVITGVPPAEFGDKLSLVVRTTTKSGIDSNGVHGTVDAGYGSFGTPSAAVTLSVGNSKWGNFVAIDGLRSGRFLDTPEFVPLHAIGNNENFFDRLDYQRNQADSFHLNLGLQRSWFQIPNQYDQQAAGQDQRQQLKSFNVAPSWSHLFNQTTLLTANAYVRQDRVNYYPSADIFSDLPATVSEARRLTNAGVRADLSYFKGIHSLKFGAVFQHTILSEDFTFAITDPAYNAVCNSGIGMPVTAPIPTNPALCPSFGYMPNPGFQPGLLAYDLTRGGIPFLFNGHADIKQEGVYAQDGIKLRDLTLNLGLRVDQYNGLSSGTGVQPRTSLSYLIKKTNTVLQAGYGRMFLSPYNENLVLSSSTGLGGLGSSSFGQHPLVPARRNQFNLGFQQAIGKHLSVDGEYFWKFTQDDFDFDVLFNSPITFPIQWRKSKLDGFSLRVNLPEYHGLTAYTVMGHTRARFFPPEVGGLVFNSPLNLQPFRIDHDQAFEQNTHVQWQPKSTLPYLGFTWSYQSGEVAGSVPDYATALTFTPDQQQQMGLFCGNVFATLSAPIRSCSSPNFGATQVRIPAPGTFNPDTNPPRVAPRNLFDASIGMDNIFRGDRYKWKASFTAINLTNKVALYNFLSTFSGTHFVAPRTLSASLGLTF
jgi:hypothetical protein